MARNKYGARKTVVDGITFDSQREANRWRDLQSLEKGGLITKLERQVKYVLAPSVKFIGEQKAKAALRYYADFRYVDDLGYVIVEDAKGRQTEAFRIKRHLMKSVHGIDVVLS
jgi:hypothetical protein